MEIVFGLILVVALLVALDVAAIRWGSTVRDTRGEWFSINNQDDSWVGSKTNL